MVICVGGEPQVLLDIQSVRGVVDAEVLLPVDTTGKIEVQQRYHIDAVRTNRILGVRSDGRRYGHDLLCLSPVSDCCLEELVR